MKYGITFLLALLFVVVSHAQIPRTLSYQGVLTDSSGNTPRPDGNYQFTFKLYDSTSVIWQETKTLEVRTKGLFSTTLGDATSFGANVKFDKPYKLGIQVGTEPELSPRIPLTSVGYSMNALRADTARVAITDGIWSRVNGSNIYRQDGNVGIGTSSPQERLDIFGSIRTQGAGGGCRLVMTSTAPGGQQYEWYNDGNVVGNLELYNRTSQNVPIAFTPNGNVGIGTTSPTAKLEIEQSSNTQYAAALRNGGGNGPGLVIEAGTTSSTNPLLWVGDYTGTVSRFYVSGNGNVGIGTTNPTARLEVAGRTKTNVLEITGGSDLAEPFEMSQAEALEPGSVVIIDEDNPGKLKLSSEPYDKRVAGVVSGAGGINPGLTLNQGELSQSGTNGAIKPGDLLTTSNIAGYAMRASDELMKPGVTIGKACQHSMKVQAWCWCW